MICENCKKEFEIEFKHRNTQRFCGHSCSQKNKKKPVNKCLVCGTPTKTFRQVTCSKSCSNKHFRSGENHPNWKNIEDMCNSAKYRSICFEKYGKRCLVCGYDRIVAVHHIDLDHKNNSPENLVPLCMNHHNEIHSLEWKNEVTFKIEIEISKRNRTDFTFSSCGNY